MKIALGCDHGGYELKQFIMKTLEKLGYEYEDFGCYSFHETKNFSMGEGGALVINDPETVTKAEILREKGR